ncbi:putative RNA methyltransferase [Actinophytocola oryzae]|uniref:23S rRNA m(1)G-748 methyltransferase n=1 Tax=Actinophytocola oryzae TaxID=502181 RepID=A0A4R7V912_9PSEU|nr:23S rRNA methyltransferase [Actinophytocola oryzae]TDV45406.1 23S rRNA m(1)G-748 methyltransferase [Actinophytocola oryzae]
MLADVLSYLCCPHCSTTLTASPGSLRCESGHTFDIARQGYVNLQAGKAPVTGDNADMVTARHEFLSAGHYDPIVAATVAAASGEGCVLDLGAGTGHYLAAVLDAAPDRVGIALEIAKPALRRAARAHPRLGAVGADTWQRLPVRNGAISVVLDVFAPRNAAETARVLSSDGRLVVVSPTPAHLRELVSALHLLTVDADKAARVSASLPGFVVSGEERCEFGMSLTHGQVLALVGMGPSAWHVDGDVLAERVSALPQPVRVTASVTVTRYVKE